VVDEKNRARNRNDAILVPWIRTIGQRECITHAFNGTGYHGKPSETVKHQDNRSLLLHFTSLVGLSARVLDYCVVDHFSHERENVNTAT
jgi:hypothetical protein